MLPRKLAHKDKFVYKLIQEIDDGCTAEPIAFPDDTTPIKFLVEMNLNEFTKILSALMTGADLSFPNEAHEVTWILLRQLECPVSLCDELIECLSPLFEALDAKIDALSDSIASVSDTLENNVPALPPGIEEDTDGKICSGASFVVEYMDYEIRRVYAEAEEGLLDNLIEAAVEILRAIPVIESLPIDELINVVNLMFENQVVDYITDYDLIYDDLVGSLRCFIQYNGDVFDIDVWAAWLEFIGVTYPSNRAAQLFAAFSPLRQTFVNDILAGIFNEPTLEEWFKLIMVEYTAGIQGTITCPSYACFDEYCDDMDTGLMADTHEFSATYPFGNFDGGEQGGAWQNTIPGRTGGGCIEGAVSSPSGINVAGVAVDLGSEKTVIAASFWYRHVSAPGASDQTISFLDDTKSVVAIYVVSAGNQPDWTLVSWSGTQTGVRYIAFNNQTNMGGLGLIDDICVTHVG